jgi:hypothetical protein
MASALPRLCSASTACNRNRVGVGGGGLASSAAVSRAAAGPAPRTLASSVTCSGSVPGSFGYDRCTFSTSVSSGSSAAAGGCLPRFAYRAWSNWAMNARFVGHRSHACDARHSAASGRFSSARTCPIRACG